MYPSKIVTTILLKSVFLTLLGFMLGSVISGLLMQPLIAHDLDLSRWMGELATEGYCDLRMKG